VLEYLEEIVKMGEKKLKNSIFLVEKFTIFKGVLIKILEFCMREKKDIMVSD
jgi:hypothetical protein